MSWSGIHQPDIIWRLVVTGAGQAIFQPPNNSALLGAAPREHLGSASGFLATARAMGQSLSVALVGTIFSSLGGSSAGFALSMHQPGIDVSALQQTFIHSFHVVFIACACIAAIGIFASLVRGKEDKRKA